MSFVCSRAGISYKYTCMCIHKVENMVSFCLQVLTGQMQYLQYIFHTVQEGGKTAFYPDYMAEEDYRNIPCTLWYGHIKEMLFLCI